MLPQKIFDELSPAERDSLAMEGGSDGFCIKAAAHARQFGEASKAQAVLSSAKKAAIRLGSCKCKLASDTVDIKYNDASVNARSTRSTFCVVARSP
jgi:hypothetical protein